MPDIPERIPARYLGPHPVRVSKQSDVRDASGTPRAGTLVAVGEVLLLPAAEVLGQTFLFDPTGQGPGLALGPGRVVLPEHAHLSDAELLARGYEFHTGRTDFAPVDPAPAPAPRTSARAVPQRVPLQPEQVQDPT